MEEIENPKERKTDRVLVFKRIEGQNIKSSTGLIDNRILDGTNNLHAIMDTQTTLWQLRYNSGVTPEPLKQKFTSFKALIKYTTDYFMRRGLQLVEIKD